LNRTPVVNGTHGRTSTDPQCREELDEFWIPEDEKAEMRQLFFKEITVAKCLILIAYRVIATTSGMTNEFSLKKVASVLRCDDIDDELFGCFVYFCVWI